MPKCNAVLADRVRHCLLLCVAFVCTACATVPERELKAYRDAFELAKVAGQEVVLDFSVAKADLEKRAAASAARGGSPQPSLFPTAYRPAVGTTDSGMRDPVQVRLRAFETVGRYNQLLTQLAEGKSVEQVAASARQLVQAVSSIVSVAPGVGPLVADFAAALERARVRAEFVGAVQKGAPVIDKVFEVLAADIPDFYALRLALTRHDLSAIEERIDQRANTLQGAAQSLDAGAQVDLAGYQAKINQALEPLAGMKRRVKLERGTAGAPASTAAQASLTNAVLEDAYIAFAADANVYLAVAARLTAYYALLERYEALLATTRSASHTMLQAVDTPQYASAHVDELLQTALLLRRDFIQVRKPS